MITRYQIVLGEQPDHIDPEPVEMVKASDYDALTIERDAYKRILERIADRDYWAEKYTPTTLGGALATYTGLPPYQCIAVDCIKMAREILEDPQ